jgi:hypothetical protein
LNNEFIDPGIDSLFKVSPFYFSIPLSSAGLTTLLSFGQALEFLIPEADRHRLRKVVVDISDS